MDASGGFLGGLGILGSLVCLCVGLRLVVDQLSSPLGGAGGGGGVDAWMRDWRWNQQAPFLAAVAMIAMSEYAYRPYLVGMYGATDIVPEKLGMIQASGTAAAVLLAPVSASYVDSYGRRRAALWCLCILAITCRLHASKSMLYLLLVHLIGEATTLVLHASVESWAVQDHREREFASMPLPETLAKMCVYQSLGGLVGSRGSSLLASMLAEDSRLDLAVIAGCIAALIIIRNWRENIQVEGTTPKMTNDIALSSLAVREKGLGPLVCMHFLYGGLVFVLHFTRDQTLRDAQFSRGYDPSVFPAAHVAATFLVASALGGLLFSFIAEGACPERTCRDIFVSLVFLVFALAFSNSLWFTYSSLLATEVLIGAALPVLAVLRSRAIASGARTTMTACMLASTTAGGALALLMLILLPTSSQALQICAFFAGSLLICTHRFVAARESEP